MIANVQINVIKISKFMSGMSLRSGWFLENCSTETTRLFVIVFLFFYKFNQNKTNLLLS